MRTLVVGSCLIDLFVKPENNDNIRIENSTVSFEMGGKFPIDVRTLSLGGNAGNVAAALKKLDIPTSLYTYLGKDVLSNHIKQTLEEEGITLLIENEESTTGSLSIIFEFNNDRIIFSHHNTYSHSFDEAKVTEKPDIIFLSSIGKEWEDSYEKVLNYAHNNHIPIAFSPGSQQLQNLNGIVERAVHQSKMLFCNMEEAKIINDKINHSYEEDPKTLLQNLKTDGFEILSVTDGANGSYAADIEDTIYKIPTIPVEISEKTGAGDAYAAAFLASYLQGHEIEECMKRGMLNSIGVMTNIGAHTGQLRISEMEKRVNETDIKAEII